MHTLLSTGASKPPRPRSDKGKSVGTGKSKADPVSRAGRFKNDPDDPTNPNEVRERHLKKIKR
jgi:hypothetical protein